MSESVIELRRDDGIWRQLLIEATLALESGCQSRRLLGLVLDPQTSRQAKDYTALLYPDHDWSRYNETRFPVLVGICPDWFRQQLLDANPHLDSKVDVLHRAGSFLVLSFRGEQAELLTLPLPSTNGNRVF
ncbi:hypothetical protein A2480_02780 [Candidatus Uhrbacteria bacterium RIFOXYC2_FULL_47_19]|uniref:Uncharacterized protein n=1 Tax=Candidatus Uhrbacteria bacterium RIFOXYC2_FULL_47_19 TaxID=1802424 RepID=A0A1F7WG92_9BACT|nr:MAG: hypothetical protein A2480_02780 [Candidatus Uhrbacteria bacterium RIFOXYC2_FULL_47_19]HCC22021.1 hypothetical protein [Candidatus Uhrbacteria bacterium]